eukprot:TRINITY_DN13942_c0_g2_i1.p1 TRINITY_DN13942_c0_g2~~TRINITY_DN13942_c0_g2_i1.p1  ORF type:complete len:158 (-),score=16.72 TRINITY_DN13942_c0_g2_i1:13-486(-)
MAKRKGKSLVIFMGSFLGSIASPNNATYGASKAFLKSFAQSLSFEVSPKIDISLLQPLYVKTRLSSSMPPQNPLLVSAEQCVASSIKDIEKGCLTSFGHWKHDAAALLCLNKLVLSRLIKWITENNRRAEERLRLSLIHICRCRRYAVCRSRWSPYH